MRALFVTATGTGVGKTFVTQALIAQLRAMGRRVRALKPVVSGITAETAADSDPAGLLTALGEPLTQNTLHRVSPFRYAAPLAPSMAAAQEGRRLPFDELIAFCRAAAKGDEDDLVIEGVGGVMVPLVDRLTVLDWMEALNFPALLVTGSYLGSLSHTLTAMDVLDRRAVPLAGIVVSESVEQNIGLRETADALASFTSAPVLALPRLDGRDAWQRAPALTALWRT